jgi:hypothetical protein
MDRTIRTLLAAGIAILYPLVVFFTVSTLVPKATDQKNYPVYPNCQDREYDRRTQTTRDNPDCAKQRKEYQAKVDERNRLLKENEAKFERQAQLALGIAILTIVLSLLLRDVKELLAGLVVGAVFVTVGAAIAMTALGGNPPKVLNVGLLLLGFSVLAALIFVVDHVFPVTVNNAPKTPDN